MIHDSDLKRLIRYVSGECSPDEHAEAERWITSDPEREQMAASLRELWAEAPAAPDQWDAGALWRRFTATTPVQTTLARPPLRVMPARPHSVRQKSFVGYASRAAAVLLIGVSALVVWRYGHRSPTPGGPVALREVTTRPGQRAAMRLADGSRVILGVASRLRYAPDVGRGRRDVYLDGEAYFEVTHDPVRPFVVHTPRAITEDLGTKFGVRAYAGDSGVRVAVSEGRVSLQAVNAAKSITNGPKVVLTAGQLGQIAARDEPTVLTGVDVQQYLAWTTGYLVLQRVTLGEALPQLGRWYDLEFKLADGTMLTRHITGSFKDEPVSEALEFLAMSLDARYERQGRTVTLYPQPRRH